MRIARLPLVRSPLLGRRGLWIDLLQQLRPDLRPHRERLTLRRFERRIELRVGRPDPDRPEHPAVERQHARGLGLAGVGRRPNRQLHHALPVEAGRKGVANTANRVLQLRALALDLLDLPGQLVGHAVELLAELGELVAAVGGHRMREVAAGHPPGCHQEGLDLRVERPADEGGEGERQEEEEHEHAQDQAAVVGHRGLERLGALEDRELHALITGAEASRAAAEHLLANLRVAHPVLGLEVPR